MTITYEFITNGENKQIVFKCEDGNNAFEPISCTSDIHFVRLVDYLVKQINDGQVIECTCANDAEYSFTDKEMLIKETIDNIVTKYNKTVQRTDIELTTAPECEPEEDMDTTTDADIPF